MCRSPASRRPMSYRGSSNLLAAQRDLQIKSHYFEESSPQLRGAERRIEALERRVAEGRADGDRKPRTGRAGRAHLVGLDDQFANLDLEHKDQRRRAIRRRLRRSTARAC